MHAHTQQMYAYTHLHMHVCTHTIMYTHTHIQMHANTYTYTHTHTQTHTHTLTHTDSNHPLRLQTSFAIYSKYGKKRVKGVSKPLKPHHPHLPGTALARRTNKTCKCQLVDLSNEWAPPHFAGPELRQWAEFCPELIWITEAAMLLVHAGTCFKHMDATTFDRPYARGQSFLLNIFGSQKRPGWLYMLVHLSHMWTAPPLSDLTPGDTLIVDCVIRQKNQQQKSRITSIETGVVF